MISLEDLRKSVRGEIGINVSLAQHTWIKIGGPADYFVEPADVDDLVALMKVIRENTLLPSASMIIQFPKMRPMVSSLP